MQLEQHVPDPTQAYEAQETWFISHHEKQPQLPSTGHQDITINQKIAGKMLKHISGQLQKPPAMATAGAMGAKQTIVC